MNSARVLYVGMDVDSEKIPMPAIGGVGTNELREQVVRNNVASVNGYSLYSGHPWDAAQKTV